MIQYKNITSIFQKATVCITLFANVKTWISLLHPWSVQTSRHAFLILNIKMTISLWGHFSFISDYMLNIWRKYWFHLGHNFFYPILNKRKTYAIWLQSLKPSCVHKNVYFLLVTRTFNVSIENTHKVQSIISSKKGKIKYKSNTSFMPLFYPWSVQTTRFAFLILNN